MMRSRRVGAFVVLAVLACARPADAGWLDFIWEMTGPRMIGVGVECEVAIKSKRDKGCAIPGWRFQQFKSDKPRDSKDPDPRFWFSTGAFYYVSADYKGFSAGEAHAIGVDPMVLFSRIKVNEARRSKSIRVTAGAGLTLQRFWGDEFEAFGNTGLKFRPLAVDFPLPYKSLRVNVAYNLRYYWDGFEAIPGVDETPTTPRIPALFRKVDQPETVHGLVIAFTF
jgi:hypothetical protein